MTEELIPLLGWTHQQLLARLGQASPDEWVCHIYSRTDDEGLSYLEAAFATLFVQSGAAWKVTVTRDRWDSTDPMGTIGALKEAYSLTLQRVAPPGGANRIMDGVTARRAFTILRDFTRRNLIDEAIGTELSFEPVDPVPEPPKAGSTEGVSFDQLLGVIDQVPPSRWRVSMVQQGGVVEFCQRRLIAKLDDLQLVLSENLLPQVDAVAAAAAGIPRFQMELRQPDGSPVAHPLSATEVERLYAVSQQRISNARP
ncbi:MAG TPA: hypothetical protein DCM86_09670 [Verrucomicrobiales bacterium]|nr:hypothetical protein [Verrucomicrobiales bacterium]